MRPVRRIALLRVAMPVTLSLLVGCSAPGPAPTGSAAPTGTPSTNPSASATPTVADGSPTPTATASGAPSGLGLTHVTTEDGAAQVATIGPDGGTLSVTGSNGVAYTLTVPAGALSAETEIVLYPVSAIDGLPSGASLRAGVQFAPDGLYLLAPATLLMTFPAGVETTKLVGYAWRGDAVNPHRYVGAANGSSLTLPVLHFSGEGAGDAPLDLQPLTLCDSADAMASLLLAASNQSSRVAFTDDLNDCYTKLVGPALIASTSTISAGNNDASDASATDLYNDWLSGLYLGREQFGDQTLAQAVAEQAKADAAHFLRAWYDHWNQACQADAADGASAIADASLALDEARPASAWGVDSKANRLDLGTLLDDLCVQVIIDSSRDYAGLVPGDTAKLSLTAGYQIADQPVVLGPDIHIDFASGGDVFSGDTDAAGQYSQDVYWPMDFNPLEIDIYASLYYRGEPTGIARYDQIVKHPVTASSKASEAVRVKVDPHASRKQTSGMANFSEFTPADLSVTDSSSVAKSQAGATYQAHISVGNGAVTIAAKGSLDATSTRTGSGGQDPESEASASLQVHVAISGDIEYTLDATLDAAGHAPACSTVTLKLQGVTTPENLEAQGPSSATDPGCHQSLPGQVHVTNTGVVHSSGDLLLMLNAVISVVDPGSIRTDKLHADWDVTLTLKPAAAAAVGQPQTMARASWGLA
jgi:hypothetical protein